LITGQSCYGEGTAPKEHDQNLSTHHYTCDGDEKPIAVNSFN
jgi:hypothetical protein